MLRTVPFVAALMAVMTGVPSKLSLASRLVVTLPSSATVSMSATMSSTGSTVTLRTWVAVLPSSSVTVTVKLSLPL